MHWHVEHIVDGSIHTNHSISKYDQEKNLVRLVDISVAHTLAVQLISEAVRLFNLQGFTPTTCILFLCLLYSTLNYYIIRVSEISNDIKIWSHAIMHLAGCIASCIIIATNLS